MATPVAISERELHVMLRVVNAPDLGDDGDGLPWSTLDALKTLIPCTGIAFNGIDVDQRKHYLRQNLGGPDKPSDTAIYWAHYRYSASCSYPERTGDWCGVTKTTDFHTLREFRCTPIYVDYYGPPDVDHAIRVCLPDGPGRQLRLIAYRGRGDPDFTECDRGLLTLLRPHLRSAHLKVLDRRMDKPGLTNRQWELLRLVDAGLSNTQIARHLHLAESAVRKHLENIFRRLQVSSRTAALARAFPARARDCAAD